jgi:hypothetical protein
MYVLFILSYRSNPYSSSNNKLTSTLAGGTYATGAWPAKRCPAGNTNDWGISGISKVLSGGIRSLLDHTSFNS